MTRLMPWPATPQRKHLSYGQAERYGPFQLSTNVNESQRGLPGHKRRSEHPPKKRHMFVAEGKINEFRRLMLPGKSQRVCVYIK